MLDGLKQLLRELATDYNEVREVYSLQTQPGFLSILSLLLLTVFFYFFLIIFRLISMFFLAISNFSVLG